MTTKEKIIKHYLELIQTDPEALKSVVGFCKVTNIKEDAFFKNFNHLDQIESHFWEGMVQEVHHAIASNEDYQMANSREKMLFFFYGFLEKLQPHRSYVLFRFRKRNTSWGIKTLLKARRAFDGFAKEVVQQGMDSGELSAIPIVKHEVHRPLWLNLLFVIDFWCKDESEEFELTDACVEKSINLAFDLLGNNVLESTLDFGKFIFQQYKTA